MPGNPHIEEDKYAWQSLFRTQSENLEPRITQITRISRIEIYVLHLIRVIRAHPRNPRFLCGSCGMIACRSHNPFQFEFEETEAEVTSYWVNFNREEYCSSANSENAVQ